MSDSHEWTYIPIPEKLTEMAIRSSLQDSLLNVILDIIQDGLCIVDLDYNLIYSNVAMRYWYGGNDKKQSGKCYERFHGISHPCKGCPSQRAIVSGTPQSGMQILEKNGKIYGQQRLFCVPILDSDGKTHYIVEYIRDVTNEKYAESSAVLLEKQNEVLKEHLRQMEEKNKRNEETLLRNLDFILTSLMTSLEKLLDESNFQQIQAHLNTLMLGIDKQPVPWNSLLSGQEIVIARYIMDGCASKEIADILSISKKTVDYHRANIRKKLKLAPGENLKQRLAETMYQTP